MGTALTRVWPGLGVNYKALAANYAADMAYFKSIGLQYIRTHIPGAGTTWSSSQNTEWRNCAQTWGADPAFKVSYGVTWGGLNGGVITAAAWQGFHDWVVSEAQYCWQQGIVLLDFEIGNEMEGQCDNTTMTPLQMQALLRTLAADVKAVSGYRISYHPYDFAGNTYSNWSTNGLGAIDDLGVHPYGNVQTNDNRYYWCTDGGFPASLNNVFGITAHISEFNIDAGIGNNAKLTDEQRIYNMRRFYSMVKQKYTRAYVYSWVGFHNADNTFAMKNVDGSFAPEWEVLLNDNHRLTNVPG